MLAQQSCLNKGRQIAGGDAMTMTRPVKTWRTSESVLPRGGERGQSWPDLFSHHVSLGLISPHIISVLAWSHMMLPLLLLTLSLTTTVSRHYQPVEITKLAMPKYGLEGGEVLLRCVFTSFQPVYSVKWYRSGKEFFRFDSTHLTPSDLFLQLSTRKSGSHDETWPGWTQCWRELFWLIISWPHWDSPLSQTDRSGQGRVLLTNISQATTGRFRCEVSEEGPMFATDTAFADLLVVVLPREGPTLEGSPERRLSIEEDLALSCVCRATLPPANLTWYINKAPVILGEWQLGKQCSNVLTSPGTNTNTDGLPCGEHQPPQQSDVAHFQDGTEAHHYQVEIAHHNTLIWKYFPSKKSITFWW